MKIPVIHGVIDRRLLVNYRVDPEVLAPLLPPPFRPQLHAGHGMVGICLIRLRALRPAWVPAWLGLGSENAAHRTAVEFRPQKKAPRPCDRLPVPLTAAPPALGLISYPRIPRTGGSRIRSLLVLALLLPAGCAQDMHWVDNQKADMFARSDARFPHEPLMGLAFYIPNRLVDFVDMVHVGIGLSFGLNVEVHPTRYGRLGLAAQTGFGVAWLGRYSRPGEAANYARAAAGVAEAYSGAGHRWRIPQWDIGARWDSIYAGVAPDEIVDFLVGLVGFDLKGDDWGVWPPDAP